MTDLKEAMKEKIREILGSWNEEGIYAISFFVESNEEKCYRGRSNVTDFMVSCNTESDCRGAGPYDERRWNYAYWRQNETPVVDIYRGNKIAEMLFDWYRENGVCDIGEENGPMYDRNGRYIGKGPSGRPELLGLAAEIARELQEEGFIAGLFQKPVPVIVHGLEYTGHDLAATRVANPHNEAADFFRYCEEAGIE